MKEIIFYRELKVLINGIRSYGIQHCSTKDINVLRSDSGKKSEFVIQVHKGFFIAQRNAIILLQKILKEQKRLKGDLKQARRDKDKKKTEDITELIKKTKYQEMVVRKAMDSIAWQLFGYELAVMRRLYYGHEVIDITDSNLESELRYIDWYIKENPDGFVLISDLTSFIQIGDVVEFSPQKGLRLGELKEGRTNLEMLRIINNIVKTECPLYLKNEWNKMNEKKKEQFCREIKQIEKCQKALQIINEGEGTDPLTGRTVKIEEAELRLDTFADTVRELLIKCSKKGHAIAVVEDCLLIGVYETDKFSSIAFDVWKQSLNITMPVVDLRQSMYEPLGHPVFLQPFKEEFILDVIQGKKIVKMAIDIDKWLKTFEEDNTTWRWMSEKETARINSNLGKGGQLFTLEGKGIELRDEKGRKQYLGEGIFSRMFTGLNTPSSMRKLLKALLEKGFAEDAGQKL